MVLPSLRPTPSGGETVSHDGLPRRLKHGYYVNLGVGERLFYSRAGVIELYHFANTTDR